MTLFHLAVALPPLPNPPISIAPITDLIYSHLPGGSFFGFVGTLPGSGQVIGLLLGLPGGQQVAAFLGALGVFG